MMIDDSHFNQRETYLSELLNEHSEYHFVFESAQACRCHVLFSTLKVLLVFHCKPRPAAFVIQCWKADWIENKILVLCSYSKYCTLEILQWMTGQTALFESCCLEAGLRHVRVHVSD